MSGNFTSHSFWAPALCYQYPILACDSFQPIPLLVAFTIKIRTLAGFVVFFLCVLIATRIICINCGNYFYYFPKGMQI
jgi:hypothetical protein